MFSKLHWNGTSVHVYSDVHDFHIRGVSNLFIEVMNQNVFINLF